MLHTQLEALEKRTFLSVTFTAGALTTPTNRTDVPLGTMGGFAPIEPFIRINPSDPANILPSSHIGTRVSTNGGATFASSSFFSNPPGTNTFNGDTGMTFDSAGRCYWVNLAGTGTSGIAVSRINPAAGASFSTVAISNSNDDKPFIAADANPSSPFANNVYVVWTRFSTNPAQVWFSRSINLGVSFSVPIQLSISAEAFVWPATVGVATNGDVYVAYHSNGTFGGTSGTTGRVIVRRSTDGGVSFAAPVDAFTAGQSDVSANVQTSAGTIPGTQFWTQGTVQPWVLPDPARPGNIYVVCNDDPNNIFGNGDNGDIVIARSTNNGANWSTATVISGPSNSFQLFPTAAIDRFGNIVVAWYDNRRGLTNASARFKVDIMATYSVDGGVNWAPEFMVSDSTNPFDPDPGAVNRFAGPPPTTRIGEYFGIDLLGGTAHVAWNGNTFSGGTAVGQQVWYDNFAINGTLSVSGDDGGAVTNDTIIVRELAGNPAYFEILVNGARQYAGLKSAISAISIDGAGGADTINIDTFSGTPISVTGGAGTDTINVNETAAGADVTILPSAGDDAININSNGVGSAVARFNATQQIGSLAIGSGGRANVIAGSATTLTTLAISFTGSATMDLADNAFVIDYTSPDPSPLSTVQSLLTSGYNSGAWNGAGINSSIAQVSANHALGYSEASAIFTSFPAVFAAAMVDNTSVLVRYVRYGDADLNQVVNLADFNFLAGNFGVGTLWNQGNFNYDTITNLIDFNLLAGNFGLPVGPGLFSTTRILAARSESVIDFLRKELLS